MKKCRVSPVTVVTIGPPLEMDHDGHRKSSSSPQQVTPLSSTPELLLGGQTNFAGVHKPPRGRHNVEDTDDEGDVRRPSEGLSPRKPSLDVQSRSPETPTEVTSTTPQHKRKRKGRKPHRSPSAHAITSGADSASAGAASPQSAGAVQMGVSGLQSAEAGHPLVRTPDHVDVHNESTKAPPGLARHQGVEELQAIEQLRQRRSPFRGETANKDGRPSPGHPRQQRSPAANSSPGTPTRLAGRRSPQADLRRLAGSLDLTSSPTPRHDMAASPQPRPSPSEMTECPFSLPPDVGTGFLLEPPVASSSQAPVMDQRKFRLTRTRSLPDLRQEAAAPEFLRNRLILQTDDTVYLPFILRKEYVIRTKLRVSFSLLKPPVVKRSHSEGYITDVTFLQQAYCNIWEDTDTELEDSDWRVDEGCNFFDLCYFRCKCCKKRLNPTNA
ncbi:uncharacterized protein LOC144103763 [Amblyomma americanum]